MAILAQAGSSSPARLDANFLGMVAQRELGKVALEIVVASHNAVFGDNKEFLILGPAQTPDGSVFPWNGLDGLPGATVDVYAGLGRLAGTVRQCLGLIAVERY